MRITHLPTGLSSECREHKEQPRNKKAAFHKLAAKILIWHKNQEAAKRVRERTEEIIRTYHEAENRVKDHESGFRQAYTEVHHDIEPMIRARRDVKNGEV